MEFATLLSAVKPKEQTGQYKILSALFYLNAHTSPVTSSQVLDLLRLHYQKKVPKNIPTALRQYKGYVEPVSKGPPLLWALTQKGLERLRTLSGMPLSRATDTLNFEIDIGIVCALDHPELTAVKEAFGGTQAWKEIGSARYTHVYSETSLQTQQGKKLKIVATTSTSMGLTAAAIATTQLVLQFRPRIVATIGIAAGTHSANKQFGDVLVADPSVDYNSGKVVLEGGIREFLPDPYPIGLNARLRSVLQKYKNNHQIFSDIRTRWKGTVPKEANHLHLGPLGAADQVIDDATRVLEIQRNWRKLIGVEMETYGVYRACHESPDPKPRFVSFKAVCDFAAEKTDSWQDYAAFVAARFAVEFFKTEWEALWPAA
jgi:nucleoside phosphorylase